MTGYLSEEELSYLYSLADHLSTDYPIVELGGTGEVASALSSYLKDRGIKNKIILVSPFELADNYWERLFYPRFADIWIPGVEVLQSHINTSETPEKIGNISLLISDNAHYYNGINACLKFWHPFVTEYALYHGVDMDAIDGVRLRILPPVGGFLVCQPTAKPPRRVVRKKRSKRKLKV